MVFSICSLQTPATFSPCSHALHSPASPFTIDPSSSCLFASLGTKGGGVRRVRAVLRQLHQCIRVDAHGGAEPPGECMYHPSPLPFTLPTIDLATASGHPHSVDIAAFAGRHPPPQLLTPQKLTCRLNPLCPMVSWIFILYLNISFFFSAQKFNHVINAKSELPAFLIKPVQRICKYPLLLDVSSSFPSSLHPQLVPPDPNLGFRCFPASSGSALPASYYRVMQEILLELRR